MAGAVVETALVTGATAGLGAEFSQQLAKAGINLVLVARDGARLQAKAVRLHHEFGVQVETLAVDLLTDDGVARVVARLGSEESPVSILINNAGFSLAQPFDKTSPQEEADHLKILVSVPMALMQAVLAPMLLRGRGQIINVADVAGFVPRGSYGAAKSWIISFSRWAHWEYGPRGVGITVVCPGFVHTEFFSRMGASTAGIPKWMWLEPERVVREALAHAAAGRAVSIPSRRYAMLVAASRLIPSRWALLAAGRRSG
ncbi:SDR family NAD(P)-dependent oxidoreductase [Arthrobacter sp. 35W]|uniref:SDR family NAD(P)-dependent oxidoreductase n=1 Tax=Arthrobacter sp. 35W TaxID=1132441 RepID=UPI000407E57F|nr:SDR family NAD(P)-dependent oxidoreductase [Arthrobacter sp. 35W]